MKLETSNLEHLGIKHSQNDLDFSITLGQAHYAAQLREISMGIVKRSDPEATVLTDLHVSFRSLLGAVVWMTQTRADIIVYVPALQRVMAEPRNKHAIALNKVLRYIKRKPLTVTYKAVQNPWKLLLISDSAFKSEDQDCLAMRSGIIALGDKGPVGTAASGGAQIWSV